VSKSAALIVVTAIVGVTYAVSGFSVTYIVSGFSRTLDGPAFRRTSDSRAPEFDILYETNCAGCHGADGKGDAARGLADPVFLRIADDATLRRVTASGIPGTAMPAFARTAGGPLGDEQIDALVSGMRGRWAGAAGESVSPPPYSTATDGDPTRGSDTFATFCSRCHGADGRGGAGGLSVTREQPEPAHDRDRRPAGSGRAGLARQRAWTADVVG
jgi:mono/diheme cytochrome c family protein